MIYGCFQVFIHNALKCHLGFAWWCLHLIPKPGRQGQEKIYECEARLFYIISSRPNRVSNEQITYRQWWDGLKSKGVCQWAWQPEFYHWQPHVRRRKNICVYLPTFTYTRCGGPSAPPQMHKTYLFKFYLCVSICVSRNPSTEMCWPQPCAKCKESSQSPNGKLKVVFGCPLLVSSCVCHEQVLSRLGTSANFCSLCQMSLVTHKKKTNLGWLLGVH